MRPGQSWTALLLLPTLLAVLISTAGCAGDETTPLAKRSIPEEVDFDDNRTAATVSNATVQQSFDMMDTDKDGFLAAEEMKRGYPDTPARRLISAINENIMAPLGGVTVFMHADKDSDLVVDQSEWAHWCDEAVAHVDRLEHTWKTMDKNKDGVVFIGEYKAAQSKDLSEQDEEAEFKAISGGGDKFDHEQFHTHYSTDDFTAADKDHDGFLTKEEMKRVLGHGALQDGAVHAELSQEEEASDMDHSFSQYDLNKDGKVSQEEYNENALEEAKLTAGNLAGDDKLEAAISGDDTYEHLGGEIEDASEPPIEDDDTNMDSLTEEETKELLGREQDL